MALHDIFTFFSASHISELLAQYGLWGLGAIALIIFCETGLVIAPFLPGDSLLFALGAFLVSSTVSPALALAVVIAAAFAGDTLNYLIGRSAIGQRIINQRILKPHHVAQTKHYFEKYGAATVFIGRFIPVVRTLAPFMAGIGQMPVRKFMLWNSVGAACWCTFFMTLGYSLGSVPWVKSHMEWMALAIVVLSVMPVGYQLFRRTVSGQ
ncbi:VTT domain-containing protein [Enterobacter sp. CC120223-11]|uniref:VTT domain-containing protein n=1 Tax=Enterobacter sp. CC120223-11 TaxID=1378073 RepID=UPI000BD6A674|nr:VTT domain-containing protein [Enterobacter sp. CC120223-11]SNY65041.1 membrane-associated protein [Enterobacter sp. CC120223-11]